MISRRKFIKMSAMAGAGVALSNGLFSKKAFGFSQSPPNIRKFLIGIPGLGPGGANEMGNYIPVLSPDTSTFAGTDYYKIVLSEFTQFLHPDLPGPTKFWGYADANTKDHKYLGGLIVAQKNRPVRLLAKNELPEKHPLPVDTTIPGAELAQNRATVHIHGGLVPWTSDGGPFSWFTPHSTGPNHGAGPSFQNPGPTRGTAEYYYPNAQSARLLWYHDHALGITRLNAYAGLATGYLITDPFEQALVNAGVIPSRQVPLIIQDKTFFDGSDATYYQWARPGELWYPYQYEPARWDRGGNNIMDLPAVSCVPEFFADTILVNGAPYPYLPVEQTRYRFRILNGSQARFYNLQLYYANASGTEADLKKAGPPFIQIGTEAGLLPAPVLLNAPPVQTPLVAPDTANPDGPFNLLVAPGERADIIIDFSNIPSGSKLILYSDAPAPFPGGDGVNDYDDPTTTPNTRTIMQFRVIPRTGPRDSLNFQQTFAALRLGLLPLALERMRPTEDTPVRDLTLNEDFDEFGRLIQKLGTTTPNGLNNQGNLTFSRNYEDTPTEVVRAGSTEVWRIFNLTGDTHPIHFHLVNCQVLWRAPFDAVTPDFRHIGRHVPPDANESGWKETVRMNPGEVTAVIMKFDLPRVPFRVPASERLRSQYGIRDAHEYVWHCHILEHEEHDMMRPLVIR